ncbi:MAG: hypothetical protein PHV99_00350 [Candidatus Pacebacteria bacterium]|nr:hypothetical protein [Candidatus Paceibacterota bacterium]
MKEGDPFLLKIDRTRSFDPVRFYGKGWTIWRHSPFGHDGLKGDEDEEKSSLVLKGINFVQISFETCLKKGETVITGDEKIIRHARAGHTQFDARIAECLLDEEGWVTLEAVYAGWGMDSFEFTGTRLRSLAGRRAVVCLNRDIDPCGRVRWRPTYEWISLVVYGRHPSIILA